MHINLMNIFPEKAARMQVLLDQAKPLPLHTKLDVHDHDYRYRPFIWIRGYAYSLGPERRAEREARVARRARWEREKEAAKETFDKHAPPSVVSPEEAREVSSLPNHSPTKKKRKRDREKDERIYVISTVD
jgi:hypothetical protein